ncbi:class I SAM-dependent methyltransferase [Falsiroseomonas stagni]|uniref:Methyltransferase domain-containing protein n=1 Tax=Falsiroseomonas stagni DSM 19981 TaxID=1123062 RepID=A0A1I4DF32_9PROT|nr:class I SAM-dependent methyltransferase [Falsiroseomonas stagni]SFK91775.1 Methyltransferase domain-containing protein [Falsiroseomonas stagni DSM 19981]
MAGTSERDEGGNREAMRDFRAGNDTAREAAAWALRLFCGREPADEEEITLHSSHQTLDGMRRAFAETWEFRQFMDSVDGGRRRFGVPPFLLRPPRTDIAWKHEQPTLDEPVSQVCTGSQFKEPVYAEIAEALSVHAHPHRRTWEMAYITSVLASHGLIGLGRRAIGFGCGRERIPSLLASRGVEVLATDEPASDSVGQARWRGANQYASGLGDLFHAQIVHLDDFERLVEFGAVDMNDIPASLDGQFDCCWSMSALHHLGSIEKGMAFVEASLRTVKPGGFAVHTMDFNLSSNGDTLDNGVHVLPRRRDVEALCAHLASLGHQVLPLNLHTGYDAMDEVVDLPPHGLPHIKLYVDRYIITSFGIAIRKGA